MKNLKLTEEAGIQVLQFLNNDLACTITDEVLQEFESVLDSLEKMPSNTALMICSEHPKNWCVGINLEWLQSKPQEHMAQFASQLDQFLIRLALLNMPTIACLNGHTFGGGALLAAACDFRIMNAEKGWFCLPEVDIKIPFTLRMHKVLEGLASHQAMRELMFTGRKVGGNEAFEKGIVDAAYEPDTLYERSLEFAKLLGSKNRAAYATIKRGLKSHLLDLDGLPLMP